MSSPVCYASFCRLCLSKTENKVPVFADENMLENLLHLIEIQIDPDDEPDAVVCIDCVVTLEGFQQFKDQCHTNDKLIKTIEPKLEFSASSTEVLAEDEDDPEEDCFEVEELEEEDCLELSEAEEVFQNIPQQPSKNKATAKTKKSHPRKVDKTPSIDEMQVLAESYPDFFYFEKDSRSLYYTLVFRGERFNSALFSERSTYWQCVHRRKYQCPAQVWVSNDYQTFQKRYKHSHGKLPSKKGQAFTPQEALPEIFQLCKKINLQKRAENANVSLETSEKVGKDESTSLTNDSNTEDGSDSDIETQFQKKRKCAKREEKDWNLDKLEAECKRSGIRKKARQGPSLDKQLVLADSYPDSFFFEKVPRCKHFILVFKGDRFRADVYTEYYTYWKCRHRQKYQCQARVRVTNDYQSFERRYEHNHPDIKDEEGQPFTPMEALPEIFKKCRQEVLKTRAKLRKKWLNKRKSNLDSSAEDQDDEEDAYGESIKELIETKSPHPLPADSDDEAEVVSNCRPKRKIKPNTRYVDGENQPKRQSPAPEPKPKKSVNENSELEALESRGKPRMKEAEKSEPKKPKPGTHDMDEAEMEELLDAEKFQEACKALKIRIRSKQGPTLEEQLVLADSYPDFFYFEKFARSTQFNMVYYGERYNGAFYTEYYTYWSCRLRKRLKCPAQVCVANDYKDFERRYEHNHPDIPLKEAEAFTPMEALPKIFEFCRRVVLKKRAKRRKQLLEKYKAMQTADSSAELHVSQTETIEEVTVTDEGEDMYDETVQELTEETPMSAIVDSDEEADIDSSFRSKRKLKPNSRYTDGHNQLTLEPDSKRRKPAIDKSGTKRLVSGGKPKKNESKAEIDEAEPEGDQSMKKFQQECKALNIRTRSKQGPSLDEQLVLADSYPDYFFFEKFPRSVHFNLVYYGERFNGAIYTEYYTYWNCRERKRQLCPALLSVTNDYKTFERRYEHTHPDIPIKEGEAFLPMEALPQIFESCRKSVLRTREKQRQKLLEKHKALQTANSSAELQLSQTNSVEEVSVAVQDDDEEDFDGEIVEELIEENPLPAIHDSDEEPEIASSSRPRRKIKPNTRYADAVEKREQTVNSSAQRKIPKTIIIEEVVVQDDGNNVYRQTVDELIEELY